MTNLVIRLIPPFSPAQEKQEDVALQDVAPPLRSFGIASLSPEIGTVAELYESADRAMYLSKNAGRDKVTVWELPPPLAGE